MAIDDEAVIGCYVGTKMNYTGKVTHGRNQDVDLQPGTFHRILDVRTVAYDPRTSHSSNGYRVSVDDGKLPMTIDYADSDSFLEDWETVLSYFKAVSVVVKKRRDDVMTVFVVKDDVDKMVSAFEWANNVSIRTITGPTHDELCLWCVDMGDIEELRILQDL